MNNPGNRSSEFFFDWVLWKEYIHLMSQDDYVQPRNTVGGRGWDLKCSCGPADKPPEHFHYLWRRDEGEKKAERNGNLGRGKYKFPGHKGKNHRTKILCEHHFVAVVHYLRCPRAALNKLHKHRDFLPGPGEFPICPGMPTQCAKFKLWVAREMNIDMSGQRDCRFCIGSKLKFADKYRRKKLDQVRNNPAAYALRRAKLPLGKRGRALRRLTGRSR